MKVRLYISQYFSYILFSAVMGKRKSRKCLQALYIKKSMSDISLKYKEINYKVENSRNHKFWADFSIGVGVAALFFMLACGIKYLNKLGSLKCWKLLNKLRNEQGADLIGGKDVDGNSGTGGISEVWVATEFLFRLIEVSWAPAPLGRSAGMLYRYLLYGEKNTHMT